jgi:hypothetical protein
MRVIGEAWMMNARVLFVEFQAFQLKTESPSCSASLTNLRQLDARFESSKTRVELHKDCDQIIFHSIKDFSGLETIARDIS